MNEFIASTRPWTSCGTSAGRGDRSSARRALIASPSLFSGRSASGTAIQMIAAAPQIISASLAADRSRIACDSWFRASLDSATVTRKGIDSMPVDTVRASVMTRIGAPAKSASA